VGIIIKRVEEELKGRIVSMKTENKTVTEKDGEKEREYNRLSFRVVIARGA
jgi:hypothetical protein